MNEHPREIHWKFFDIVVKDNYNETIGKGYTSLDIYLDIVEVFSKVIYDENNGKINLLSDSLYLIIHEYRVDMKKIYKLTDSHKNFDKELVSSYTEEMIKKYNFKTLFDSDNDDNEMDNIKKQNKIRNEIINSINEFSKLLLRKMIINFPPATYIALKNRIISLCRENKKLSENKLKEYESDMEKIELLRKYEIYLDNIISETSKYEFNDKSYYSFYFEALEKIIETKTKILEI